MFPTLIELGPLTIHTYGLMIALAFLAGLSWSSREATLRGLDPVIVQDIGFYAVISAIAGSRLLYVLINPVYFWNNPAQIVMFWKGGLVFLGGVLAAAATMIWYLKHRNQPILQWADCFLPGVALGQAIGRIGCLAAGCCYGAKCDLPWAITFTNPSSLAPLNVPLHPTQLYDSLAGLVTFGALVLARRRLSRPGQVAGVFLLLYPVFRVTVEFFRDDFRGTLGPFSVTQVIAMGLFALGVFLLAKVSAGPDKQPPAHARSGAAPRKG